MKPVIDLNVALMDFSHIAGIDTHAALDELLCLLLDPVACQARGLLIERLAAAAEKDPELSRLRELPPAIAEERWDEIIDVVGTRGPVRALEQNEVTLDELDALTWNSDALMEVHERLCQPLPVDEVEPVASEDGALVGTAVEFDETAVSLTSLAERGDESRLELHLQPLIPAICRMLGWPDKEDKQKKLLDHLVTSCNSLGGRRFRECVDGWLRHFAETNDLPIPADPMTDADWERLFFLAAVLDAHKLWVDAQPPDRPAADWVVAFFDAIDKLGLTEPAKLLDVSLDADQYGQPIGFDGFRRDIYGHISQLYDQLRHQCV